MGLMRSRRKFDGHYYTFRDAYSLSDKSAVRARAERMRNAGGQVRIVKTKTGYQLWAR